MTSTISYNLTNALWFQHLMQPDFDAWLTNTPESETLAMFHALSGSINVVGDLPGEHNPVLIARFVMPNGRLFNLSGSKRASQGSVSASDIHSLSENEFAVFSFHHGFIKVVKSLSEPVQVSLKPNQSDVITFVPVCKGVAAFGCPCFCLSAGPLSEIHIDEDALYLFSFVTDPLLIYCKRGILEVRCNGGGLLPGIMIRSAIFFRSML